MNDILIALIGAGTGAFVSGAFAIIGKLIDKKKAKEDLEAERQRQDISFYEAIKVGVCEILYTTIYNKCIECIGKGFITAVELRDIQRQWVIYHNKLDGNGFLDELMSKISGLPIR